MTEFSQCNKIYPPPGEFCEAPYEVLGSLAPHPDLYAPHTGVRVYRFTDSPHSEEDVVVSSIAGLLDTKTPKLELL